MSNRSFFKIFFHIKDLPSISKFKSSILDFFRPKHSSIYNLGNNPGLCFLTRLRVDFSHLRDHKFRHGFLDTIDPFCNCRDNCIETTEHFLLHCSLFSNDRAVLFSTLRNLDISIVPLNPIFLSRLLLYGDVNFSSNINQEILVATMKFISDSNRFSGPL